MSAITGSPHREIREMIWYGGDGTFCFGAWFAGDLVAACFYWNARRYQARNFWPLSPADAKLVQVTTAKRFRGRGVAASLIGAASASMMSQGFENLYARIWHSNRPSLRAFRTAGWRYIAFVAEFEPPGLKRYRFVRKVARP